MHIPALAGKVRPPYPGPSNPFMIAERLLRQPMDVWRQISLEYRLTTLMQELLLCATLALAGYGGVMGLTHGLAQALVSAIKLPLLFLLTLAICLPTLYLFNLLCGGRLSARQSFALILSSLTATAVLLLPFAPITLFFLATTPNYHLLLLLNVAILALTGVLGVAFLIRGAAHLNTAASTDDEPSPPVPSINMLLLHCWLGLYGIVGAQLGWTLRPFFGDPTRPFQLFRPIRGNVLAAILDALIQLIA